MAKWRITRSCGHEEVHNLSGPQRDRDRKEEWLKTGLCSDCYKARIEEERSRAAKEAAIAAKQSGLPPLVGSEKQIRWAEQIRAALLLERDHNAEWVRARARDVGKPGGPPSQESSDQMLRILARIEGETKSSWWIDQRNSLNLAMIVRQIILLERQGSIR